MSAKESVSERTSAARAAIGFSKGVTDYLNHYVSLADAKAEALAGLNVALCGVLLSRPPSVGPAAAAHWLGVGLNAASIACATICIWPRLYRGGQGMIFWEDIGARGTPAKYVSELQHMDEARVEEEYARHNFFMSRALRGKYRLIRWSIGFTVAGITAAGFRLALQQP